MGWGRAYTGHMNDPAVFHRWQRLTDLGEWRSFRRPDLDTLRNVWDSARREVEPERGHEVMERLAIRWAIETGAIERLYTIERGITESIVSGGLSAMDAFSTTGGISRTASTLIRDQRAALDFVFDLIKDRRALTTSYIRELHQLLCRSQTTYDGVTPDGKSVKLELHRGAWKMQPNNPRRLDGLIHEYCPPEFVQDEMDALIRMHAEHTEAGVRPEVEAAWLHHRFAQIHPFEDGNGRVARALATLVFLQHDFLPLVVRDAEHRDPYIDALEAAERATLGRSSTCSPTSKATTWTRQSRWSGTSVRAGLALSPKRRLQLRPEVRGNASPSSPNAQRRSW